MTNENLKSTITKIVDKEMMSISEAIAFNELAEDELQVYKEMAVQDWIEIIYDKLTKQNEKISELGKETIIDLIKQNESFNIYMENLDSIL